jgi:tight adherence protein B
MSTPVLVAGATFARVMLLVVGAYWMLVARTEEEARSALKKRMSGFRAVRLRASSVSRGPDVASSDRLLEAVMSRTAFLTRPLAELIRRSGKNIEPGQVALASIGLWAAVGFLAWVEVQNVWVGVIVGAVAAFIPYVVLRRLGTLRIRKFEEQFPEAVDLIARSLRAGHAFPTGLRLAGEELPEPASIEFRRLYDQQNFGMPLPEALKDFAVRVPLIDARFFVTAVLTQREAGGNLAEVLDNLAAVIRDRFRIQRQLRVSTAHGRLTGLVLSGMPPVMAILFALRSPVQMRLLITDPTGIRMLVAALVLQVIGALIIKRVTNVEY